MLICGLSGSGKTNTLVHVIYNLLYFDKIFLYEKNLEQLKYQNLLNMFNPISDEVDYDITESSKDRIRPESELTDDNRKLVTFDNFVCEKI